MKKLLSICFLSILLGLLSFSTQAQSNNGSNSCASGFWIENLQPTPIHEIANLPAAPTTGDLPLTHTLGQLWYGSTGQYLGNAHPGQTELYELHFCNTCNLDPKTKVSIDWLVIRDGDTINDRLSDYMEFSIYTFYSQLNQYGECQSISWMGGQVNDGFGYCEPVPGSYTLYDSIHGLNTGCNTPTNYPGALQVTQGSPYSVLTNIGMIVPAMGPNHIYTEALDYYYLDFFMQTRNIVQIKWKQVGDYKLVMRIRERTGGTAYNNLTWNANETTDFIGGHQSCCGQVLAEDVLTFPSFGAVETAVCENETWTFGRPAYTFNADLSNRSYDTLVVFGDSVGPNGCRYFEVDSIYKVDFFVRHTPVIAVKDTTLCRCETPDVMASVTVDTVGLSDTQSSYKIQWKRNNGTWSDSQVYYTKYPDAHTTPPATWNGDTVYTYIVHQINTYDDTLDCVGPQAQFSVTLKEMLAPEITYPAVDTIEYCIEAIDANTSLNLAALAQDQCGTTIHWYTKLTSNYYYTNSLPIGNTFTSYIDKTSMLTGATPQVFMANYLPSINKDTTLYFFATSYNEAQGCESRMFDYFVVLIHQTPELIPHITKTVYCQHDNVEMQATVSTQDTDPNYTFVWNGVTSVDHVNPAPAPANLATEAEVSSASKAINGRMPMYAYYENNYSQQIFTSSEVPAGNITKMAFHYASSSALTKKGSNVDIYLATTTKEAFASKADFVTSGLVPVYSGSLNAKQGWNEIEFTTPYNYTGEENLVLVVHDHSGTYQSGAYFTCSNTTGYKSMLIYQYGPIPANPTTYTGSAYRYQYRSDVKFTVVPTGAYTTTDDHQYAYNQLTPTGHQCGDTIRSSAYVVDGNGCVSQPVNFVYVINDTLAPTVTGTIATTHVNACKLDATNTYHFNSIADLPSSITIKDDAVVVGDNCGFPELTMTYDSVYHHSDCEDTLVYTYTVSDWCNKTATFTHTFIARDDVAPTFAKADGSFPYVRLFPVEGGNCTFNSPDSMTFVNAVAPFVHDNCTDSASLMSTLKFNWENITESPIHATNIFREKNHLTVEATITDKCGNSTKALVIYLDRPEKISIKPNGITSTGNQCFGDTATLTFDPAFIADDTIMGPFVPYTYAWSEVNDRTVNFSDVNALTTNITFPEAGDYTFVITVTDRNGCSAVSEPISLNVRALPVMTINHIVLNGQTEPYCPTYGNLTVEAQIVNPVAGQTIAHNAYTWTGESVNIHSDSARTWVTITPEYCDTIYPYYVTVVDDRGCVGVARDTIDVASFGPQFIGTIADTTVEKMAGCVFRIPNLKDLVDANLVEDECYTFAQLKYSDAFGTVERTDWYSQSPAAGTLLTGASQVVKITVKNPCGKTATLDVNVLKPTDVLTVSILPTIDSLCQEEVALTGITYTATVTNELPAGSESYNWELIVKPTGSTATIPASHTSADLTVMQALESGLYQYKVNVTDGLGCTASATADLFVMFQGADPITRTWPNTLCERYNGALAVDTAPRGYAYRLEHQVYGNPQTKISDVPAHMPTDWTTIVFDSLRPGYYNLTVYTNDGCERTHVVFIDDASAAPAAAKFTKGDVTVCTNDNGTLNINAVAGFTYELYRFDGLVLGDLLGTATSYNNLSTGDYLIHAIQNATHCVKDTTFTLNDASRRPIPDYTVPVANKNCDNAAGVYTGQIKITSSATYQYTVYAVNGTDTTWYLNNELLTAANNPITGLKNGNNYYVKAYDPATGCSSNGALRMTVGSNISTPAIDTTTTPNHYCTTTVGDGTITFNNANRFLTYELDYYAALFTWDSIGDQTSATMVTSNKARWSDLKNGTYKISAVADNYCTVTNSNIKVGKSTVNPTINASATENPSCVENLGTIKLTNTNNSGYKKIASYTIQKGAFQLDSATNASPITFANLESGTYTYYGVTTYGCESQHNTITVGQYAAPAMQLTMTPNHMCEPTFEKPGDGTIKIISPLESAAHPYVYKFYDAAGNEMTVPYDLPLTHTKYWLAAGNYRVVALDTLTGCTSENTIEVTNDFYSVDFDYETTVNYICNTSTVGNGSITVTNPTSTNPDAVFAYSLDGVTYQLSPTFTGLKDGTYDVYVKDTTMQCLLSKPVAVNSTDSCAPVLTICDNNGLCGDQFDYCYNAMGIQLCGSVNDTCNPANTYSYGWYAPCADPSTSNTNCIDVQTNHYVVNGCDYIFTATNTTTGCSYSKTVNVAIHPNPALSFKINGVVADIEHSNPFCENEELHIELVSTHELDTTSIEWTLPTFIAGTGFADFKIKGDTVATDNVTFCVRASSKYGCPSPIASLPVTFKRIAHVSVDMLACDGTCIINNPDGTTSNITKPASATYPYSTTETRTYTSVLTGCDSVVTYNITLIAAPEITGTPTVDPFCESANKTLADFEAGYTVEWNDVDPGTMKWMAASSTGTYTKVTTLANVTAGDYVITNAAGTKAMTSVGLGAALDQADADFTSPAANMIWQLVKNSDNTYSIYSPTINKYVGGLTSNGVQLLDGNTAPNAKWNISFNGSNVQVRNVQHTDRYLKYNTSSPRFASYNYSTPNTTWLALYKSDAGTYEEVPSTTALTYDYVTTHSIKRVAHNGCGDDEEAINFTVYKQPVINSFVAGNRYCAGDDSRFAANISTFGTPATAKLFIEGNTTPIASVTVNGLDQPVTFPTVKLYSLTHNGKTVTLNVTNDCTPDCGSVTIDSVLAVDTTIIDAFVSNVVYCVGDEMTIADFGGFDPSSYDAYKMYKMVGAAPAPASDVEITLPYTHTNQSMDSALVYVVAENLCFPQIISNVDTIFVNGKPTVASITDIESCAPATFTLTEPKITWNGSDSITSGWLLLKGTAYQPATLAEIKDSALCPKTAYAAYYAQGTCGYDTAKFTVKFSLPPTASIALSSQCPNVLVTEAMTSNYDVKCGTYVSHHYSLVKADGTGYYRPVFTGLKFSDLMDYNGGKLSLVITTDCGTDSVGVVLNIPVYAYDTFKLQNACNNTELSNFIQAGTYDWKGTVAPTLTIDTTYWAVNGTMVNPTAYTVDATVTPLNVTYSYVTSCHDTITTDAQDLTPFINDKPTVDLTDLTAMCEGDTIKAADLMANLTVNYIQPATAASYDTTWYIGTETLTLPYAVTYADSGMKVIVSISEKVANSTCGNVNDTIELIVNPRPNPTITGPAKACADMPLSTPFEAQAGFVNYLFTVKGDATPTPATQDGASNTFYPVFSLSTPLSSSHDTVFVTVEDANGCIGTSSTPAIVRVTNAPEFIFKDSTGTETHTFSTMTGGDGLAYTWLIGVDCYTPDQLVYVEYDIYYNDVLIPNANIGDYLNTQHTAATPGHPAKDYVTKNFYEWCATDGTPRSDEILYNYSMANPSIGESGNHFPYSNLGLGTGHNYLDDLWISFLAERPVKKTFVPFLISGDYKVVYRLYATSNNQQLNEYYSPSCTPITDLIPIGGHSALASGYTQTLLAIDSITIHVGGANLAPSTDPNDEPAAPELAPVISNVETIAPDMEVWPNPAPAVETTLKARVHNMNGNATVTLTSLTGKQVYTGNIYIDNDNYYFEFNVNSLSVGSYIMTVRTDTDVITKKVIVARLAK